MIIRRLTLTNFGIYSGETQFDLSPQNGNGSSRPVILIRGKNGTGKTTLMEAIRLCLHGSLALGSRVSRDEYRTYLIKRIHRSVNESHIKPNTACINLELDYVSAGKKRAYHITRSWQCNNQQVKETLRILEDGHPPADINSSQQGESFLRELVSPAAVQIFFFDGEQLQQLADDDFGADALAEAMETLFGLNLVSQLQKDLDVYLGRQASTAQLNGGRKELQKLHKQAAVLRSKQDELKADRRRNQKTIAALRHLRDAQEQKIASAGHWFAKHRNELKTRRQHLAEEIEDNRQQVQELASGLLPFAISPQINRLVSRRLYLERDYEYAVAAQQILEQIIADITDPQFLSEFSPFLDTMTQRRINSKIKNYLFGKTQTHTDSSEIILQVSAQDRQTMLSWIEQASKSIPRQFCQIVDHLNALEADLKQINHELDLVPDDEALAPLVETLLEYDRELTKYQKIDADLTNRIERLDYDLEQTEHQLQTARQQISDHQQHNRRVQLATKTHTALSDYARELREQKARLLGHALTDRFNILNRKTNLVESVVVDPHTFGITLFRGEQILDRKQLSAGEKQLLAIASMWALRDVSGTPMPVILDTPLGRLDSEHRLSMLRDYFPHASHQVILLVTDAEIDNIAEAELEPYIAHTYNLSDGQSQKISSRSANNESRQALIKEAGGGSISSGENGTSSPLSPDKTGFAATKEVI
ncbi:MAG: DNA sulfur modification protein DndD [Anaerolineaceae bacterium 4572_5.2]|nr:MAG: DNA sulfur modification protein DndD [Anaerolineaceae bacterium 4572_5.2]